MPLIEKSGFKPFPLLSHHYLQTIPPALFRQVPGVQYKRTRFTTQDDDFFDIDFVQGTSVQNVKRRAVILVHGLEGHSRAPYMLGAAQAFVKQGWDVIALNLRGCSGTPNRKWATYYAGHTDDLRQLADYLAQELHYATIFICGYSLGGNIVLKYLCEAEPPAQVRGGAAISATIDLSGCEEIMTQPRNWIYTQHFLNMIAIKFRARRQLAPPDWPRPRIWAMGRLRVFDEVYTAPAHGFESAADYYQRCSALFMLENLRRPALLLNALDDPFLSGACFPRELAAAHPLLTLEAPARGGHVGFIQNIARRSFWSEQRATNFAEEISG